MLRLCRRAHRLLCRGPVRSLATQARELPGQGAELHGFRVEERFAVPARGWQVLRMRHACGAEHLHVDAEDRNKAFSVLFSTVPQDDSGVAHVLEHTALCGSRRYPVRDPFFNMLKRSLNTFMNAWTGPDFTAYPFSTQNDADFANLLDVYLDAAFFPLLTRLDFLQEGWRLEEEAGRLARKGVVYNEMKGAMGDQASQFRAQLHRHLYRGSAYALNSGGDPAAIPGLTHEALVAFHARHYSAANARFFSFGALDLPGLLAALDGRVLSAAPAAPPPPDVGSVRRLAAPARVRGLGPPLAGAAPERQASATLAWLPPAGEAEGPAARLRLHLLAALLVDGPSAPLYRARLATGLGTDWAPCTGFAAHAREPSFCLGVQGLENGQEEEAFAMVQRVLEEAARDGFPPERVEAMLHQLELSNRFVSASFGLDLFQGLLAPWMQGEPLQPLFDTDGLLAEIRADAAAQPRLFPELLQRVLLDNPHCVRFSMRADVDFAARARAEETTAVEAQAAALDDAERARLLQEAEQLRVHQAQEQDKELLPSLEVSDVPAAVERVQVRMGSAGHAPLQLSAQPTNGLSFLRVGLDVGGLGPRQKSLLPLLTAVLTEMGTAQRDYRALAQRVQACTGGISATAAAHRRHESGEWRQEQLLLVSSHALDASVPDMADLLQEVLTEAVFEDEERFRSLLDMESLVQSGHSFAASQAAAFLSEAHHYNEQWTGVAQLRLLQELAATPAADTLAELRELAPLLAAAPVRLSAVAEERALDATAEAACGLAHALGGRPSPHKSPQLPPPVRSVVPINAGVNFVAQAIPGPASHSADWAALKVLGSILSQNYLHPLVREQGGAYGAGASVGDGGVTCFSYRDPNLDATLDVFDGMGAWALDSASFSAKDIDEAKLSVFGAVDAPLPPSRKGHGLFMTGVTDDQRQALCLATPSCSSAAPSLRRVRALTMQSLRETLLAVDAADLRRVAERYLAAPASKSVAVVGNAEGSRHQWTVTALGTAE